MLLAVFCAMCFISRKRAGSRKRLCKDFYYFFPSIMFIALQITRLNRSLCSSETLSAPKYHHLQFIHEITEKTIVIWWNIFSFLCCWVLPLSVLYLNLGPESYKKIKKKKSVKYILQKVKEKLVELFRTVDVWNCEACVSSKQCDRLLGFRSSDHSLCSLIIYTCLWRKP